MVPSATRSPNAPFAPTPPQEVEFNGTAGPKPQVMAPKLWVRRTLPGAQETQQEQLLEVTAFVSQPAVVKATLGRTIATAPYEFVRIDVGIEMPVYPEEVLDGTALAAASGIVGAFLASEEKDIRAAFGLAPSPISASAHAEG